MKKILFTEKQLKNILGEDFNYLDKADNGCDFPKDSNISTNSETLTKEPNGDENPTLDKIATQRMKSHPYYRKSTFGTMYESKKKELTERNHKLDGEKFILPKNVNDEIDANAESNKGDIMLNNMSKEKSATANCLYVRQNRLRKMKKEDPNRYKQINGKRLEKSISDTLNRATSMTKAGESAINNTDNINNNKIVTNKNSGHRDNTIYYENN